MLPYVSNRRLFSIMSDNITNDEFRGYDSLDYADWGGYNCMQTITTPGVTMSMAAWGTTEIDDNYGESTGQFLTFSQITTTVLSELPSTTDLYIWADAVTMIIPRSWDPGATATSTATDASSSSHSTGPKWHLWQLSFGLSIFVLLLMVAGGCCFLTILCSCCRSRSTSRRYVPPKSSIPMRTSTYNPSSNVVNRYQPMQSMEDVSARLARERDERSARLECLRKERDEILAKLAAARRDQEEKDERAARERSAQAAEQARIKFQRAEQERADLRAQRQAELERAEQSVLAELAAEGRLRDKCIPAKSTEMFVLKSAVWKQKYPPSDATHGQMFDLGPKYGAPVFGARNVPSKDKATRRRSLPQNSRKKTKSNGDLARHLNDQTIRTNVTAPKPEGVDGEIHDEGPRYSSPDLQVPVTRPEPAFIGGGAAVGEPITKDTAPKTKESRVRHKSLRYEAPKLDPITLG